MVLNLAVIDDGAKRRINLAVIEKIPAIQIRLDMRVEVGIVTRNDSPLPRFSNQGV